MNGSDARSDRPYRLGYVDGMRHAAAVVDALLARVNELRAESPSVDLEARAGALASAAEALRAVRP